MDDFTDTMNLITDVEYKNLNILLSDNKSQEFFNDVMRGITKKFYKERLNVNIIIPSANKGGEKTVSSKIITKAKQIGSKAKQMGIKVLSFENPFGRESAKESVQEYEDISLFNDYITTDALDFAITEVSLEEQFMKEVEECGESEGLLDKVYNKITELDIQLENMGSSLENKYEIIKDLKDKIAKQELVIEKVFDIDEDIFVI